MGNTYSAKTQRTLATAAMAKYMHLTKPQLVRLRDTVLPYSNATKKKGMIERPYIEYGLNKCGIENNNNNNNHPSVNTGRNDDTTILGHLFTLCDTGKGQVDCMEFMVGISVLACKTDSFGVAIRFALRVLDVTDLKQIDSRNAFKLLRGICTVASCFGDTVPTGRQLYKLIDSIYDAVTMVSQDYDGMPHNRFVRRLVSSPLLKAYILVLDPRGVSSIEMTWNMLDAAGTMSDDSGVDEQGTSALFDSALAEQDTTTTSCLDHYDVASEYTPQTTSLISALSGIESSLNSTPMSSPMPTPCSHL